MRRRDGRPPDGVTVYERSEEHTSELQSRLHLVCRLLLEKKNNRHYVAVRFAACTFGGSWCGRPLLSLALAEAHGSGEVLAGHEGGVDAAAYAFRRKEAIV